ncbi:isoprenyl transferase [Oceanobacillus bengalensis]|uniref:isoprenyl transferase n=1 Tax=Oceanobacillus bengalensis TaxID=1435466 RepID=UPI001FEC6A26|nr:isoprenyl transferase [Oceanobacillus bengalensis]
MEQEEGGTTLLSLPKHVAIIMDGNGRWGEKRGLSRSEGHFAGVQAMEKIIDACFDMNIKILTLYAFSSENWNRPKDEVNYLMYLPIKFFKQKLPIFMEKNIKILATGNIEGLPKATKRAVVKAVEETKGNNGLIVNFALNYGGRMEILQACQKVIKEIQDKKIEVDQVDESLFQRFLYTTGLPDPDIIIRTGGEQRISNFLLWQSARSELHFIECYFPDFDKKSLAKVIYDYDLKHTHYA